MDAQALQAVENIEVVLHQAGYELADIVRMTFYVTDVEAYRAAAPAVGKRLGQERG
jgi:enamine deaminase RidA (YjgF/YER057c/UK114 family)